MLIAPWCFHGVSKLHGCTAASTIPDIPTAAHVVPNEREKKLCYKTVIGVISFVFAHCSIILNHVFIDIL